MSMYSYEPPDQYDGDVDEAWGTCGICEEILAPAECGLCSACKAEQQRGEAEVLAQQEENAAQFAEWYLGVKL